MIPFYVKLIKVMLVEKNKRGNAMNNEFQQYRFDEDALREMDNFKRDFLSNRYKKDKSENKGPNYKQRILLDDQKAFEKYLDDADSQDFLNLD